jgi:ATP-dependent Clp protease ATP-binding subunit ClpX
MMRDLMRLLDVGHTLHIENGNNPMEGTPNIVELPTENLLVVFSGAFSGIEKIIQRRMRVGASMGFGATKSGDAEAENYMKYVTTEDLEEWGFLPEFLGRIGVFAVMNPLTVDTIVEIMKQAKGNILEGHVDYASHNNVDLRFSDEALRIIAEKAYASGLGFRNVKAILSEVMNRLYFTMSDGESGESRVVNVDREFMKNNLMTR